MIYEPIREFYVRTLRGEGAQGDIIIFEHTLGLPTFSLCRHFAFTSYGGKPVRIFTAVLRIYFLALLV